jgi:hypothetical protein
MPEGFTGTMHMFGSEVWLPFGVHDEMRTDFENGDRGAFGERAGKSLMLVGRLKPGVSAEAAQPVLKGIAANLEQAFPLNKRPDVSRAPAPAIRHEHQPIRRDGALDARHAAARMAAVVLLVACLNLANMLLARGQARRKEIAIRLALGAGRGRIIRQLLTEGFVLSIIGGAFGVVLALWSSDVLMASPGGMLPFEVVWSGGPNPALLAAALGFCALGTLCFGLGPALKLSRAAVVGDLKEHAGEDVVRRRWRFMPRNPMLVVQFAFSLALVTAAALFIRGAGEAANIETGLKTARTFLVEVDASLSGYDRARGEALYRALGEKLSALPGVESASISATVPFGMFSVGKQIARAGLQASADDKPATAAEGLAFGSAGAAWVRITSRRQACRFCAVARSPPPEATQPGGPAVAIIDDTLARRLWPEGDALGQRVQIAKEPASASTGVEVAKSESPNGEFQPGESIEVIGIVPHTRNGLLRARAGATRSMCHSRGVSRRTASSS